MGNTAPPSATAEHCLIVAGPWELRAFPLAGPRWSIGRDPGCDLCLRDPSAAALRLVLERDGDRFWLRASDPRATPADMSEPPRTHELEIGQAVTVGSTRITLERRPASFLCDGDAATDGGVEVDREVLDQDHRSPVDVQGVDPATAAALLAELEWSSATATAPGDIAPRRRIRKSCG